jgi:hypothetical protein
MAVAYGVAYPLPGPGGLTDANWRQFGTALGEGVVNDFGEGFGLTKSPSTRLITMTLGQYRIQGVQFEPTQDTISFTPTAPTGGAVRRDRIVVRYDPAAKEVSFVLKEGTQVTTGVAVGPTLTRSAAGVWEKSMYTFAGGNVAADQLDYVDDRVWVAPTIFHVGELLPTPADYPYGQHLIMSRGTYHESLIRRTVSGVPGWISLTDPPWLDVNIGTTLKGDLGVPQYQIMGGQVRFRGQGGPRTGPWSAGPSKGLGNVPIAAAPSYTRAFAVALRGMSNQAYLTGRAYVEPTGQITLDIPDVTGLTVGSVDYSGIFYDLGA